MIILPEKCLRGCIDCEPYGQIESDNKSSFCCVGKNYGTNRVEKNDIYRYCFQNDTIDTEEDCDKRDLVDQLSVIAQALSVIENE